MPFTFLLTANLLAIAAMMLLLWLYSLARRDVSIVDVFWGVGFAFVAWITLWLGGNNSAPAWLIVAVVSLWGFRLGGFLAWRNLGKPEDYRYRAMRQRHGTGFPLVSLFSVFALQGLLMWTISLPVQTGVSAVVDFRPHMLAGFLLWATGLAFESIGDFQLARFKSRPENRGRVLDRGLWRYTRHPNYFGDFLVWWGIWLTAAQTDSWWWTIVSPVLMSFLLIRVSGVRLLESSLEERVAGYREYMQTTSAFFPLPPQRN